MCFFIKQTKCKVVFIVSFILLCCLSVSAQISPMSVIDITSKNKISRIEFSPDGSQILIGGVTTELWDISTGKRLHKFEHPTGEGFNKEISCCVKFSPDGKYLATSFPASAWGWGDTILWDTSTGEIVQTFRIEDDLPYQYVNFPSFFDVENMCFSDDGKRLYTVTHQTILHVWDIDTGEKIKQLNIGGSTPFAIYPDETRCVSGIGVYSLEDGSELMKIDDLLYLKNDSMLMYIKSHVDHGNYQYQVHLLDMNTYEPISSYPVFNEDSYLSDLDISTNGSFLTYNKCILSTKESSKLGSLSTKMVESDVEETFNHIVFSSDEQTIAAISDSKVYIYDISDLTSTAKTGEGLK